MPVPPGALGPVVPSLEFRCIQARTGPASPDLLKKKKKELSNPKISFRFSQEHRQFRGGVVRGAAEAEGRWAPAGLGVSPPPPAPSLRPWRGSGCGDAGWGGCISPGAGSRGMSAKLGGRWVSFLVSCLRGYREGAASWLYTSAPSPPKKPSREGFFQPMRDGGGLGMSVWFYVTKSKPSPQRAPRRSSAAPFFLPLKTCRGGDVDGGGSLALLLITGS